MTFYAESRGRVGEAEPIGPLTEGAAGIAVIVLAVVALAGVSAGILASIAAIVIGVGLIVQAFNSAAEETRVTEPGTSGGAQAATATFGAEVMVDCMCGLTGIVLGILALVGVNPGHLLPPALIVFGGSLLLGGVISMRPRTLQVTRSGTETQMVAYRNSPAAGGIEILTGLAAVVLGILSVIMAPSWVLLLVGFLVVGAALLMVSASFAGAALRVFASA